MFIPAAGLIDLGKANIATGKYYCRILYFCYNAGINDSGERKNE